MAFQFVTDKLPAEETQALLDGLTHFVSFQDDAAGLQDALRRAAAEEGQSSRVFTLNGGDLLESGKGLQAARLGGWRVAANSGSLVVAGDIYTGSTVARRYPYPVPAGVPRLACIRTGDEISKLLYFMQQLSKPPFVDNWPAVPFNLHLLLLPGLVTDALWLEPVNQGSATSFVVPFLTRIRTLEVGRSYTEDSFRQIVQPVVKKWSNFQKEEASRSFKNPTTGKTVPVPLLISRRPDSGPPPSIPPTFPKSL